MSDQNPENQREPEIEDLHTFENGSYIPKYIPNAGHETYIVMYDDLPLFAFRVRDNAERYIETACKYAMDQGYNMEKMGRTNFFVVSVPHFHMEK